MAGSVIAELRAEAFWIESTEAEIMKPRPAAHWHRSISMSQRPQKVSRVLLKPTDQNTTSSVTRGCNNSAGYSSMFLVMK